LITISVSSSSKVDLVELRQSALQIYEKNTKKLSVNIAFPALN